MGNPNNLYITRYFGVISIGLFTVVHFVVLLGPYGDVKSGNSPFEARGFDVPGTNVPGYSTKCTLPMRSIWRHHLGISSLDLL